MVVAVGAQSTAWSVHAAFAQSVEVMVPACANQQAMAARATRWIWNIMAVHAAIRVLRRQPMQMSHGQAIQLIHVAAVLCSFSDRCDLQYYVAQRVFGTK